MEHGSKRAADAWATEGRVQKKAKKSKRQWPVPQKRDKRGPTQVQPQRAPLLPGDSGIWATCARGREARCIGELTDLFAEYATQLYGPSDADGVAGGSEEEVSGGIEDAVAGEIAALNRQQRSKGQQQRLFIPVRLDVPCVAFFKTVPPVEPVALVRRICEDAMLGRVHTRAVMRLSPITLMGRASVEGLEDVARHVLQPHFHNDEEQSPVKKLQFAIRPSLRNHNVLTRDVIIKRVASIVGQPHQVDLQHYNRLIVVEVFQNVCGIAVVDNSFERLRRCNLAEINAAVANAAAAAAAASNDRSANAPAAPAAAAAATTTRLVSSAVTRRHIDANSGDNDPSADVSGAEILPSDAVPAAKDGVGCSPVAVEDTGSTVGGTTASARPGFSADGT